LLAVVGILFVSSRSVAAAEEPTFLGRTSDQWLFRLDSDQPHERIEAAWAIAQYAERHPRLRPSLRLIMIDSLASHEDAAVRYWMVDGLRRVTLSKEGDEETRTAAKKSLQTLLTDKAPAPRIAAAETLGLLGESKQALPVLIEAMSHPQEAVRIQAVAALERLGEAARPAEQSLRTATSDSSEYVKRISARALQKLDATKK
jgi:hypothetical protein